MVYVEFEDDIAGAIPASGLHGGLSPGKALVRYEAPPGPKGEAAIGFLKPSGDILGKHPTTGEIWYVSDQRWIYDLAEAANLEKSFPDRFVKVKG